MRVLPGCAGTDGVAIASYASGSDRLCETPPLSCQYLVNSRNVVTALAQAGVLLVYPPQEASAAHCAQPSDLAHMAVCRA